MDTDDLSVARIIGKAHETFFYTVHADGSRTGPWVDEPYTVDDMLAWLDEHTTDWRCWPTKRTPGKERLVMVRCSGMSEEYFDGPTLHAALEEAVRHVADA